MSSFKRKHSFRKVSGGSLVSTSSKSKDDLQASAAARRPGQLRTGGAIGRPSILAKPSVLAKPAALSKASGLASPGLVAGNRPGFGKANSPSTGGGVSLVSRGRGGRGRGLRGIHPTSISPK